MDISWNALMGCFAPYVNVEHESEFLRTTFNIEHLRRITGVPDLPQAWQETAYADMRERERYARGIVEKLSTKFGVNVLDVPPEPEPWRTKYL